MKKEKYITMKRAIKMRDIVHLILCKNHPSNEIHIIKDKITEIKRGNVW